MRKVYGIGFRLYNDWLYGRFGSYHAAMEAEKLVSFKQPSV